MLTNDQKAVFDAFVNGKNIFLCGKGGSGKSHLTRVIIDHCKACGKGVLVCAPTGVAAINVGGSTIHRTFSVPVGIIDEGSRCGNKKRLEVLEKTDVVIIDEISMCRIDVFEHVANTLLSLHKKPQLLVVGDFYQLPPVLGTREEDAYSQIYGKRLYPFESRLWYKMQLRTMELQTSMRQKDKAFVSALDNIREGKPDFEVFSPCLVKSSDPSAITLCGKNDEAAQINQSQLDKLIAGGAKEIVIKAKITGVVESGEKPTDEVLRICEGAKVVMLNNDNDGRWVNGTFGEVVSATDDLLHVKIGDETHTVERHKWATMDYVVRTNAKGEKKVAAVEKGSFEQFPIKKSWAITIHKSQGATYDSVNVNASSIFAEGQLYVSLSRCRSLDGLRIIGTLTPKKLLTSDVVLRFMSGNYVLPEDAKLNTRDYQEGYDDGYEAGTKDTTAKYADMVAADPTVKKLSPRVAREKEKELLPPEQRNPKGAGRKPKAAEELRPTKAVRVPLAIADAIQEIAKRLKDDPSLTEQVLQTLSSLL